MKKISVFSLAIWILAAVPCLAQDEGKEPWRNEQLLSTATLASVINNNAVAKPVIFCIGPGAPIKGSIEIGPGREEANLIKLKRQLAGLPKDKNIVLYCGCCPFANCPNIRPAFSLLNSLKFTNHKLLDIPKNIKVDWIDKGFPVN
jgi:thiosulfate/3-mercaptopyruvate sulfurtransferase